MSLRRTAFAALGVALLSSPSYAQLYIDANIGVAPPAARYEVIPAPRPGYVWTRGFWDWRGSNYVWVPGSWIAERPGYVWVEDRWDNRDGRWRRWEGHWAHTGDNWNVRRNDWNRFDDRGHGRDYPGHPGWRRR